MFQQLQKTKFKIAIWLAIVVPSFSLMESPFCTKLNETAKNMSIQFQLLNGSNRIAEAQQLLSLVINDKLLSINESDNQFSNSTIQPANNLTSQAPVHHSSFNIQHYSFSDLKKIFGNPSTQNDDGSLTYIYNYNTAQNFCISYNKQTQQSQLIINN